VSANAELSIVQLVGDASTIVQIVMAILVFVSIASWAVIFAKSYEFRQAEKQTKTFENAFWSSHDLTSFYTYTSSLGLEQRGMYAIFSVGFKEFVRLKKQPGIEASEIIEGAQRAMKVAFGRELDQMETRLPFLATVASVSPYIGLFGTVWGIMNSFVAFAAAEQVTLAMVAPGIAEALVATAMGLFAAIPAVVAYNKLSVTSDRLLNSYENFAQEFLTILQRQAYKSDKAETV
jgi:biopolymer transport protein TolQ